MEAPPRENQKLMTMKKLLIKHLKQEHAIQAKLDESLNIFADKIAKSYKSKLAFDFLQKEISDELCSISGKKDEYRKNLNRLLRDNGQPNKLQNLYFYFCKFGLKNLGFDDKSVDKELIKEINNCLFLNVSFKSTKFTGIKFKTVKFINASSGSEIYNKLMNRSDTLRTLKDKFNKYDSFSFENVHLINCWFEDCIFNDIQLKSNIFGITNFNVPYPAPIFINCKFIKGQFVIPPPVLPVVTTTHIDERILDKYKLIFKTPLKISEKLLYLDNGQIIYIESTINMQPKMICDDCKFISYIFTGDEHSQVYQFLFINCIFTYSISAYNLFNVKIFKNTMFSKCTFNNTRFNNSTFIDCCFKDCIFNNVSFNNCNLGNIGSTEFDNCEFNTCKFSATVFHNYLNQSITTIIRSNCKLLECIFNGCLLINFKFNFDSIYKQDDSKILSMKKSTFICCNLYGTNFDYCDLEGSSFAARTTCVENVNWFGNIFINNKSEPSLGINVTRKLNDKYVDFKKEFEGSNNQIKKNRAQQKFILQMKYSEYFRQGIDLDEFQKEFKPYDYFIISNATDYGHYQFIPATSFYRANIRSCNFQSIQGFQGFDFTQISRVRGTSNTPDLNSTNFTHVNLTNANLEGANLIGTVFQVADIKGVNFQGTTLNDNTDFENTMNTGLAVNTEHINFGDLQNRANETHARAQFIINNRNKLRVFYADHRNETDIKEFEEEEFINFTNRISEIRANLESQPPINVDNNKLYLRNNMSKNLTKFIASRLDYTDAEKAKLKSDLDQCINEEFVNILVSVHEPLRNGEPGRWFWLSMVFLSINFLFSCPKLYLHTFMLYYFNEVFNAHGTGSKSCVLGMVERWITIHSQTCEHFLMTLDVTPTPDQVKSIQNFQTNIQKIFYSRDVLLPNGTIDPNKLAEYNKKISVFKTQIRSESNKKIINEKSDEHGTEFTIEDTNISVLWDYQITSGFIEKFNDSSKISEDKGLNHKYKCNTFINLLKPKSELPENKTEDIGVSFDYNISPKMREDCYKMIKAEIDASKVETIDEICKLFVNGMIALITNANGIKKDDINYYLKEAPEKVKQIFVKKLDNIKEHLQENEVPNLKMDIMFMCGEEITIDDLKEYFADGGGRRKRKKTQRKGRGLAKSLSLPRSKTVAHKSLSRRTKSATSVINSNLAKLVERVIVTKFANLSKDKLEKIFNKTITINSNLSDELLQNRDIDKKALSTSTRRTRSKSRSKSRARSMSNKSKYITISDYPAISLKNMNITDKPYGLAIKKQFQKIKENYKNLLYNEAYVTKLKQSEKLSIKKVNINRTTSRQATTRRPTTRRATTRRSLGRPSARRHTRRSLSGRMPVIKS